MRPMEERTAERLLALNREFYTTFAQAFASSRSRFDPALKCILPYIPLAARVLDVGCGSGRLALLLDVERPGTSYLGLDVVPELVALARAQTGRLANISASFRVVDLAQVGWGGALGWASPDVAVALAVLHHIPGRDRRGLLLREMAQVLRPGGSLIVSTWQFLEDERLRRKVVDWAEVGIAPEELDPGDYLLDWKRGGRGLRYCHLVDRAELEELAAESSLRVRKTFRAGGRAGNLSLVAVLDPVPDGSPDTKA
jgi:SAM-dependent methyltransferase